MKRLPTTTPDRPLVAPSILSADFARLGEETKGVLDMGADLVHVDIMDGHFVPNLSMGPAVCGCLHQALPDAYLDVHLMVERPEEYFEPFQKAGANLLSFHMEVCRDVAHARELCTRVRDLGCQVGVVVNPPTDPEPGLELADDIDLALVMGVNPGYSGQAFIEHVLSKGPVLRQLPERVRLEIDGGVAPANAAAIRDAGFDVLVTASALFGRPAPERAGVIEALKGGASG